MHRTLRHVPLVVAVAAALTFGSAPASADTFSDSFSPCYPTTTVTKSGGPTLFTLAVSTTASCGQTSYGTQAQDVTIDVTLFYGTAVALCTGGNGHLGDTYSITASCTATSAPAGVYSVAVTMSMWPYQDPMPAACHKGPPGYNYQDCSASHTFVVS
jgi:hypothetical protein